MDVEKLSTIHGSRAGQVSVVERVKGRRAVRINDYIKHDPATVTDYNTKYSRLTAAKIKRGKPLEIVRERVTRLIKGNVVVTLAGEDDFHSLGIAKNDGFVNVELQDTFRREDGRPLGLGPLCDYFNIDITIDHDCVGDAWATLLIYLDHMDPTTLRPRESFDPEEVMTTREYRYKKMLGIGRGVVALPEFDKAARFVAGRLCIDK